MYNLEIFTEKFDNSEKSDSFFPCKNPIRKVICSWLTFSNPWGFYHIFIHLAELEIQDLSEHNLINNKDFDEGDSFYNLIIAVALKYFM